MSHSNKTESFSIFHLFLWGFCVAVVFGSQRFLSPEEQAGPFGELRNLSEAISSMIAGTIMAGAIVLSQRWSSYRTLGLQPGHWIIILGAFRILFFQPLSWASVTIFSDVSFAQWTVAGCAVLPFSISLLAVFKTSYYRWKVVLLFFVINWFLIMSCYLLVPLGYMPLSVTLERAYALIPFILAIAVAVALSLELDARPKWDWLHWVGVATVLCNFLTVIVWRLGL